MEQSAQEKMIEAAARQQRRSRCFAGAVLLLSLVVAGGVSWRLHQTAYTLTAQPCCGVEEHTHTEQCRELELICGMDEQTPHVHGSECFTQVWESCTIPEHLHTDGCFEPELELICTDQEHTHTEECFERPCICQVEEHTHDEACFLTQEFLTCGQEEHTHGEDCYGLISSITCTQEAHTHGEECYREETELSCTAAEHTHGADCYRSETVLRCDEEEHIHGEGCYEDVQIFTCPLEAHTHGDSCYTLENVLACTQEHDHTDECYRQEKKLSCERLEHTHTAEACYSSQSVLACTAQEHTHGEDCYAQVETLACQELEHSHTEECWTTRQVLACPVPEHTHTQDCIEQEECLLCTLEEHAHDEQCREIRQEQVCEKEEHIHGDACFDEEPVLTCQEPEHSHGEDCYAPVLELDCLLEEGPHVHSERCYIQRICGRETGTDHVHTEKCYALREELVCGLEEQAVHVHTEDCYRLKMKQVCDWTEHVHSDDCEGLRDVLCCTLEEGALHVHDESCYAPKQVLCCDLEHTHQDTCYAYVYACGQEVHIHGPECYPNPEADVETRELWEQTLPQEKTGIYVLDVVAAAQSQLGYGESLENYILGEDGQRRGYTRYGAWYGNSYGDWDAMFAAFCLYYGGVPQEEMPYNCGANAWLVELDHLGYICTLEEIDPYPGFLVFLDTDGSGAADLVGIIESAEDEQLSMICGNLTDGEGVDRVGRLTMDFQDSRILAFAQLPFQEPVALLNVVENVLSSDDAYIDRAYLVADSTTDSGYAIRTGTGPWDDATFDGANNPGLDSTDRNNVVRSFDSINYTMEVAVKARENTYYREGWMHYEFILPCTGTEGFFDTGSMTWLDEKNMTLTTDNDNGIQILRGKVYLTTSEEDDAPFIGNSLKQFTCSIQMLAASNNTPLVPKFTFWMDGNQVPTDRLVTGNAASCEAHGDVEPKTITSPPITVTAVPRFNVALTNLATSVYGVVDNYDFSTGYESACNKSAGIVYGRQAMVGISVQIYGLDKTYGLRGCEIPNGEDITFDITLNSSYLISEGNEPDVTNTYTPLVWSYEGNAQNNNLINADGRRVNISDGNAWFSAATGIPYNTYDPNYKAAPYDTYRKCHNGGTWSMTQEGNVVHVTISGYEVNPFEFPSCNPSMWNLDTTTGAYYNPQTENPWKAWPAFFSTGEMWIIQPFKAVAADGTVKVGDHVLDQYGSGTLQTRVQEGNLQITTVSGQKPTYRDDKIGNSNQMVETDDLRKTPVYFTQGGTISSEIMYTTRYDNYTRLTEDCEGNGKDWVYPGNNLGIVTQFGQYEADTPKEIFAMDMLIKFDDTFFEPDGTKYYNDGRILFAAKPEKTGWNHKGKNPEDAGYDDEMRRATIEDLVYFTSLEELKARGYTCVGAIRQFRGEINGLKQEIRFGIGGKCKGGEDGFNISRVFMTTFDHRGWIKESHAQAVAAYVGKSIDALTDDDYKNYAVNGFPKISGNGVTIDYSSESSPYPPQDYANYYAKSSAMQNYAKVSYDENAVPSGSAGRNAADSCLVVSVISEIGKTIIRQSSGAAKQTYDMDQNQRVVDYELAVQLKRGMGISGSENAAYTTNVYVMDTLPATLTYIPGSAYQGGTYTQTGEGKQGTITGGSHLEPGVTKNADGTTTLRWEFPAKMTVEQEWRAAPIRFSCKIGNPGEPDDVVDNQDVSNKARVWTDDDTRAPSSANGNLATISFKVKKTNAVSIVKAADQATVEVGSDVGFKLTVTNGSANPRDVKIVDVLPYAGDGSSTFTGVSYVTAMTDEKNLAGFTFYYTTETKYRGQAAADYSKIDFVNNSDWKPWARNENGTFKIPYESFSPVAIAVSGTVPANQTMRIHILTQQPEALPGDKAANRMYSDNFEIPADSEYTASLGIQKVSTEQSETGAEIPLSGAEFALEYRLSEEEEYQTAWFEPQEDGSYRFSRGKTDTTVSRVAVGSDGTLHLTGFLCPTWRLREVRAPEGYAGLTGPVDFTIGQSGAVTLAAEHRLVSVDAENKTLTIGNDKAYALPMTGGTGTILHYFAGAICMLLSASLLIFQEKRTRGVR